MQSILKDYITALRSSKKRRLRAYLCLALLSLLVAGLVVWQLSVPGVTMTDGPVCGIPEHQHTQACYGCDQVEGHVHTQACYSCGNPESEHEHTEACYVCGNTDPTHVHDYTCLPLICMLETEHVHTDACLICGQVEHVHTNDCYNEPKQPSRAPAANSSTVLDGDIAKVSGLKATKVITGTAPFDTWETTDTAADDRHVPGKDFSDGDAIIRTFDTVTYNLSVTTEIDSKDDYRSQYRLLLQAVAELDQTDKDIPVSFDKAALNYMTGYIQQTVTENGKTYVILLGWIDINASETTLGIPGSANYTLKLNVNNMIDGQHLQTRFYSWLDYNASAYQQAGKPYADDDLKQLTLVPDPTAASENNHPVNLEQTQKLTVSAAPKYNVQLGFNPSLDALTNVSIANHPQKAEINNTNGPADGDQVYGRVSGLGVTLQLYNNNAVDGGDNGDRGLMGIQLPDPEHPITFTIHLSATQRTAGSGANETAKLSPFLYEYEESSMNSDGTGRFGLPMYFGRNSTYPAYCAPKNRSDNKSAYVSDACYDGGTWDVQPVVDANGKLTGDLRVTVKDYQLSPDKVKDNSGLYRYQYPANNMSGGTAYSGIIGCFSSCYLQIMLPLQQNDTLTSFTLTASDQNLQIYPQGEGTPAPVAEQRNTKDDSVNKTVDGGGKPGKITMNHYVTPICKGYGSWANSPYSRNISASGGGPFSYMHHSLGGAGMDGATGWVPLDYNATFFTQIQQSEVENYGRRLAAVNTFIKFDADGCTPVDIKEDIENRDIDGVTGQLVKKELFTRRVDLKPYITNWSYNTWKLHDAYPWIWADGAALNADVKFYYVAKADGTNWVSDKEMSDAKASTGDFLFFPSVEALKASNRVCVGVYMEFRSEDGDPLIDNKDGTLWMGAHVRTTGDEAKVGNVYDMTSEVEYWSMDSVVNARPLTFSEDAQKKGSTYAQLKNENSHPDGSGCFAPKYERVTYVNDGQYVCPKNSEFSQYGVSYLVVGNISTVKKEVSELTMPDSKALKVDEQREVKYTVTGTVNLARNKAGDIDGMSLTITDTLNSKTQIRPGSEITLTLQNNTTKSDLGSCTFKMQGNGAAADIVNEKGVVVGHVKVTKEGDAYTYCLTDLKGSDMTGFVARIEYHAYVGEIGGDENTVEVKNGEVIKSRATIHCDGDARVLNPGDYYSNSSTCDFNIVKQDATGLHKKVNTRRVDVNTPISYTVTYSRTNTTDQIKDLCILDILPYNGDTCGSAFHGSYQTGTLTFDTKDGTPSVWAVTAADRGTIDSNLSITDVTFNADGTPKSIKGKNGSEFCFVSVQVQDGKAALPVNTIAVFVKTDLAARESKIQFDITLEPQGNIAADIYSNRSTAFAGIPEKTDVPIIAPPVSAIVVQRDISGTAWADLDNDGVHETGEKGIPGVQVNLYRQEENGSYTLYSDGKNQNLRGQTIAALTTDADGNYCFEALPAGTYKVVFTDIDRYGVSPANVEGVDDALDSDAIIGDAIKDDYDVITGYKDAAIDGLKLKACDAFTTDYMDQSLHNDIGLVRFAISLEKLDLNSLKPLSGAAFCMDNGYYATEDWTDEDGYREYVNLQSDVNGKAVWYGLKPGIYMLWEVTPPDGYYQENAEFFITISADGTYQICSNNASLDKNSIDVPGKLSNACAVTFQVYNTGGYELPDSGGIGTWPFVLGGLLLMAAPLTYVCVKRRERRSNRKAS